MKSAIVLDVLLRWQAGGSIRAIARETRLDRKTVRKYLAVARTMRLERWMAIDEEVAVALTHAVRRAPSRVSETQQRLEAERELLLRCLAHRMNLTRIHAALGRLGVRVSYATLRRFAIAELGWRARPIRSLAA
jgi:hypothetical protein